MRGDGQELRRLADLFRRQARKKLDPALRRQFLAKARRLDAKVKRAQ